MANIKVFLDTDVIINWLSKEIDPKTGSELWKAPYEITFVLRRKKKWKHLL